MTLAEKILHWWREKTCPEEFLCDNCKYDHPSACVRPERPNAVKCPDYRPKGR
ncbi:MAG TPA: hypothetical protein PLM14_10665 [Candidatus Hydrogenedentes bacterium]|nr:hypothetical protein [Candidatus Hydrogenedentota bacterium]HQE83452.1 hypothetical protein [Candidatus Hydrogenedentota bacterium]HQH53097.1 hypothetical protein [Candidatus Hydrogenedentota bacterium]HQM51164.1 hypothetical protein [Candidatus Hydrogenedentota bacterium]